MTPPITNNPMFSQPGPWHRQLPAAATAGALHPLRHLVAGVWLQARRRNEIWVAAILLGLYLAGALVLRIVGMEGDGSARFVGGLGLELGSVLSAMLVIVMGGRQIPGELEMRTIYPVLAKPVTREQLLLGKALPVWMLGVVAMFLFTVVTLAVTPRLAYQSVWALMQALVLKTLGLAMLTALVFWLALWLPSAVAMLLAGAWMLLGGMAQNALAATGALGEYGHWAANLLPDLKLLEQFGRFVDGGEALGLASLGGLMLYGALWTALLSWATVRRFRRLPL